jgi:hypothetical protein
MEEISFHPSLEETISITRALAELKLLDSRIGKKIEERDFVFLASKKNRHQIVPEVISKDIRSTYQSITDLIQRRNKIKSAIILSNAVTKVKLKNEEMNVAEVIERKSILPYYRTLLTKLKRNKEMVLNHLERNNQSLEHDLQTILEINFGKQSNNKTNPDDIENISKAYRDANRSEIIDPLQIDQKIKEIEEMIEVYETESNFVLSESNATTKIKI